MGKFATDMKFIFAFFLMILLAIVDLMVGSESISLMEAIFGDGFPAEILLGFRLPKMITAVLAGAALSSSGLVMQTVFRNPLAGPYMLGVSSGASLGVAIFMMATPFVGSLVLNSIGVATSAWIGAVIVLVIVMVVSLRLKDIMAVLILGMMIGSAASAFVDVLQFFSDESALKGFVLWSMGSLGGLSSIQILVMSFCVIAGLLISVSMMGRMDLLLLGENYAATMGVDIIKTRSVLFIATALMAGGVTAFCGPIAFIGLAAPHVARMIWRRATGRVLLPSSLLTGVSMMLLCDIISSASVAGYPLPLNTVASMLGIPVVVMVVWNGSRNGRIM